MWSERSLWTPLIGESFWKKLMFKIGILFYLLPIIELEDMLNIYNMSKFMHSLITWSCTVQLHPHHFSQLQVLKENNETNIWLNFDTNKNIIKFTMAKSTCILNNYVIIGWGKRFFQITRPPNNKVCLTKIM
jgi:hypothetical protein